jgi:hypothetical protein
MPYPLSEQGVKALRLINRHILTVCQIYEVNVIKHVFSML